MNDVLITGGAGGLGRALATYFADRGWRVFSLDKSGQQYYPGVVPVKADLRDASSVEEAKAKVTAHTDRLNAVIHLAGLYMMDSFAEISEQRLETMIGVNLMGVYRVNKAFLPLLLKAKGRVIIVTSELAGQKPLPFTGVYALTKTALGCYADSLRLELQLLGIKVTEVRPGAFGTGLIDESLRELARLKEGTKLYSGRLDRIEAVMQQQTGTAKKPEKLARLLYKAAASPRPKMRISVNANILLRLYSAAPRGLQAAAMRWLLEQRKQRRRNEY